MIPMKIKYKNRAIFATRPDTIRCLAKKFLGDRVFWSSLNPVKNRFRCLHKLRTISYSSLKLDFYTTDNVTYVTLKILTFDVLKTGPN